MRSREADDKPASIAAGPESRRTPSGYLPRIQEVITQIRHLFQTHQKVPSGKWLDFGVTRPPEHEGIASGEVVNPLIDGLCGKRRPAVDFAQDQE
jgi:hypothetical protein